VKKKNRKKTKSKKRICSEVSVNSLRGIRGASPEEAKEGYCRKDLQKKEGFKPSAGGPLGGAALLVQRTVLL